MHRSEPLSPDPTRQAMTATASRPRRARALPLVAIAGASGKTSTGWLLVQLIESDGLDVGAWLSDGVYVDRQLRQDELHAWELATMATRAREIDHLVQEIPAVLAHSLVPGTVQIGVLTSICGSDDQCQRDSDAVRVQNAMAAVTNGIQSEGTIVATADDLMVVDVAQASEHRIIYYALNSGNPVLRSHLESGGDAVWVHNRWVKSSLRGSITRIVKVADLPSTLDGQLTFQVQNSLAAIAAMLAMGGDPARLADSIPSTSSSQCLLSRSGSQIREFRNRTIIVDQPRSLLAIKQLVRAIRSIGPRRVVHRIGALDRLENAEASEASRIVGSLGGIALLTAGGVGDSRTEMIKAGLMNSSNPPAVVIRERSETTLDHIESLLEEGDIALVLDNIESVI